MLAPLQDFVRARTGRDPEPEDAHEPAFAPLRMLAAQLLLVTGAEATLDSLASSRIRRAEAHLQRPLDYAYAPRSPQSYAATWGPSLIAPLAATAHLAHLSRPGEATTRATRVLDAAVVGLGVLGLAQGLLQRRGAPTVAPLALATAGLLGLLIDRQERAAGEQRRRLERRASLVERLVPQRRARRLDRVVVHV